MISDSKTKSCHATGRSSSVIFAHPRSEDGTDCLGTYMLSNRAPQVFHVLSENVGMNDATDLVPI